MQAHIDTQMANVDDGTQPRRGPEECVEHAANGCTTAGMPAGRCDDDQQKKRKRCAEFWDEQTGARDKKVVMSAHVLCLETASQRRWLCFLGVCVRQSGQQLQRKMGCAPRTLNPHLVVR